MDPILSNVPAGTVRNEPRDLLSRLYREIGISAVAAALQISDDALDNRERAKNEHAKNKSVTLLRSKAA